MGCGAAEATGLGFVCFVFINPCVFLANRVDLGRNFLRFTPPPQKTTSITATMANNPDAPTHVRGRGGG